MSITLDLYDGDMLIRRLDIECPPNVTDASQMYDWMRLAIQALQGKINFS